MIRPILAAAIALSSASIALASHEEDPGVEVTANWENHVDGGLMTDDVSRLAVTSRKDANSVESVFVTASRAKPDGLPLDDLDVVTTAFDAETGEVRWTSVYDAGPGIFDTPATLELNYQNIVLHVVAQSGADAAIVTYAVSSGSEVNVQPLPGASVNGSSITVTGSEMAVVGRKDGMFHFASYEPGPRELGIDSSPVAGEAFDVAMHNRYWIDSQGRTDWEPGSIASHRTFVATGRTGNFAGADAYTAAWRTDQSGDAPLWSLTWDGAAGDWDEGLVAETGHAFRLGLDLAWTAARTRNANGDWDIAVRAHDLSTGAPLWSDDVRIWAGADGSDDEPVAMWYNDATRTLYVTGTTDRGFPHGTDIVTLAYQGITGAPIGAAFSSGDVSNGDDAPTGITTPHDGSRVFVAAEILDLLPQGGTSRRAGVFAFTRFLAPAGFGLLGDSGSGTDHVGGIGVGIDQSHVRVGGSYDPESLPGHDLAGASFPVASFLPEPGVAGPLAAGAMLLGWLARRRT